MGEAENDGKCLEAGTSRGHDLPAGITRVGGCQCNSRDSHQYIPCWPQYWALLPSFACDVFI